ncbi:MAG: SDR family oxidoreductase [Bacteroidetes bacterium]|nr:SDR family oxidoreductase [Bacteroidota bacterium]
MESVKGKKVLLVGATGGIGRRAAALLRQSGADLFLTGRKANALSELATELSIPALQTALVDLQDPSSLECLSTSFFSVFPQIDVLVNASGIGIIKPLEQLEEDDFRRTLEVNLTAPFVLMKKFLPSMKQAGKGLVIHIPGVLGKVPMAGAAAYSASKYGLVGMIQSLREECKRTQVRFTLLYLGGVDSPFWDGIDLRVQRDKMIVAEEAAKAIWFLCQQPASGVVSEMVLQPFNHQAI